MIDPITHAERLLTAAGYYSTRETQNQRPILLFESRTVLGFACAYSDAQHLLERWVSDYNSILSRLSFVFRRAGPKAWNAYAVFMASTEADHRTSMMLHAIEEDLSGTRKIARAGLNSLDDVRATLLPLLPIQNAPQLEAVDMEAEVRQRAQEVPDSALRAFFEGQKNEDVLNLLSQDS